MTDFSRRQVFRAAGGLAVVGLAAGCTNTVSGTAVPVPHPTPVKPPAPPNALEKARKAGTIGVLTISDDKPFSYADSSGGVTGESVEVIKAVCTAIGIARVNFELTSYDTAQTKMLTVAASGDDSIAFFSGADIADPTICAKFDVVPDFQYLVSLGVPSGNPKKLKTIADVISRDLSVAADTASPLVQRLQLAGVKTIKKFPTILEAAKAVTRGTADCLPFYDISLKGMVDAHVVTGLEVTQGAQLPPGPMVSGYEFVKRTDGDTSLRDAFAAQLQTMQENGQWLPIATRFGLTRGNALPPGYTFARACP